MRDPDKLSNPGHTGALWRTDETLADRRSAELALDWAYGSLLAGVLSLPPGSNICPAVTCVQFISRTARMEQRNESRPSRVITHRVGPFAHRKAKTADPKGIYSKSSIQAANREYASKLFRETLVMAEPIRILSAGAVKPG